MKLKLGFIGFESNPDNGTGTIIRMETGGEVRTVYSNAIEAWNAFTAVALRPFEVKLRDELEKNGFNRWTGIKGDNPTESELYAMDLYQAIRRDNRNG